MTHLQRETGRAAFGTQRIEECSQETLNVKKTKSKLASWEESPYSALTTRISNKYTTILPLS